MHIAISDIDLPQSLKSIWPEILGHSRTCSRLTQQQTQALCQKTQISIEQLAQQLLPMAASFAQVPISKFYVGAVLVDEDQQLFMGANYERDGLPLSYSLHAEQAALYNAISHGCSKLKLLTVTAAPCGHCRQFLRELTDNRDLTICFEGKAYTLAELLPSSFGPEDLGVTLPLRGVKSEPTTGKALAQASYAPYSHSPSAVIGYQKGKILAKGWYLENAAFNPSASPLALMLSQLKLAGYAITELDQIELVMQASATITFEPELKLFCQQYPHVSYKLTHI